jgi:hypothetical protein
MMNQDRRPNTGRVAFAVGCVATGSALSLGTYFLGGGPFGTINDLGNAAIGTLSGWLAWRLRESIAGGRMRDLAVAAALAGAGLTVAGSALVISGTTGFLFAGLVSSLGFAGIGTWLLVLNRSGGWVGGWPRRLRSLGVVAGGLMAMGAFVVPAIAMGFDDVATAPAWAWLGFISWLGTYLAYPAWSLWLGGRFAVLSGRPDSARSSAMVAR